ncbi:MAG: AMP-binding protein [Gammaproteobacteria bacterium]|nr:AMP-binding protein [Gammaproteobacteria bacterium]
MNSANIASYLPAMAASQAETLAVAVQSGTKDYPRYTYHELNEISDTLARGLQDHGIGKGTRTVLMVTPGLEFFAFVFALFKVGAVMIAVDPGIGRKNLGQCLQEAEPEAFIGVPKAHLARLLFSWARASININIVVEAKPLLGFFMKDMSKLLESGRRSQKPAVNEVDAEDSAAILFTSGSTGVPKGVDYSHQNFTAQLEALRALYDIQPGEVDLATFPLFALFAPALGMTSIIPQMDFTRPGEVDAAKIFQAIEQFSATSMFGSPALIDRVGKWGVENGKRTPTLKRAISAGAPVSAAVIQRFSSFLEKYVQVFTPYGATEALPVASIGSDEILGETGRKSAEGKGVCVGKVVADLNVSIIAISDDKLEDSSRVELVKLGQIGEITVQGAQVTASYYNRPESTELAKIKDGDNFYHRMGDLGYFDEQQRLWFCGRKSERVELADTTLFTACVEGVFNAHARVRRSALVGVKKGERTVPFICIELEADSQHTDQRVLTQELLDMGSHYEQTAMIQTFLIHPGFPVDIRHNAKIARPQLAEWAQEQI